MVPRTLLKPFTAEMIREGVFCLDASSHTVQNLPMMDDVEIRTWEPTKFEHPVIWPKM
jgi:hypothetical protein